MEINVTHKASGRPKRELAVVFDFDQTIAPTDEIRHLREARNWEECARRAPVINFYDGACELFERLMSRGASLYVASTAPRQRYLDHFLKRVPSGTFVSVLGYRNAPAVPGLTRRAAIKLAHLEEVRRRHSRAKIYFVGDDTDDASAAEAAGIAFVHACWGGRCRAIAGAHAKNAASVLAMLGVDDD